MLVTAVHLRSDDVLPSAEAHEVKIETMRCVNGREFCGPTRFPMSYSCNLRAVPIEPTA